MNSATSQADGERTLAAVRVVTTPKAATHAVVFVHGFIGHTSATWARFPDFVRDDARLHDWDILLLGYPTHLSVDVPGVWAADPGIDKVAERLATELRHGALSRYAHVALIAHSMGGLAVQRVLVDAHDLLPRVSHVVLFGTPSNGLKKAALGWLLKPALQHMTAGGEFITHLRQGWNRCFGAALPFGFVAVAGERDEFVPAGSSLAPFRDPAHPARIAVVPGDHMKMVKPERADALCVQLVVHLLSAQDTRTSPVDAAAVALELDDFRAAIDRLLPHVDQLDAEARVRLAIALDRVGRRDDAIAVLRRTAGITDTDAMGTLAGRLKRRWLSGRIDADAHEALALYGRARDLARAAGRLAQVRYLGINVAFLQLLYQGSIEAARATAQQVLADCAAPAPGAAETSEDRCWRLATEGEALLIRGDTAAARQRYRDALSTASPEPWQVASMRLQALHLADRLGGAALVEEMDAVFRPSQA